LDLLRDLAHEPLRRHGIANSPKLKSELCGRSIRRMFRLDNIADGQAEVP
jgi:hypothetical protein